MSLESNSLVTVAVNGASYGIFMTKAGGEVEASDTKIYPGGMAPQVSLGGPVAVSDVTVSKLFDVTMQGQLHGLMAICGRASASVSIQPLDRDGAPTGRPIVYSGILKQVNAPGADSNSDDAALVELVIACDGAVG